MDADKNSRHDHKIQEREQHHEYNGSYCPNARTAKLPKGEIKIYSYIEQT
jgi:hypothetical protein